MKHMRPPLSPDLWMRQIFDAKAARDGGIVRRNLEDVERILGRPRFERELIRRGYHAVENAGQIIVFCNNEPIRLLL